MHRRLAEGDAAVFGGVTHQSALPRVMSRQWFREMRMLASAPDLPTVEERGHSLELAIMTASKTTVPDKRDGSVERKKTSEKEEMLALLVKSRPDDTRDRSAKPDRTENCCDVGSLGWLPDRTVISIWRERRIVRNTSITVGWL